MSISTSLRSKFTRGRPFALTQAPDHPLLSLLYSCSRELALDHSYQAVHRLVVPATCQVSSAAQGSAAVRVKIFRDVLMDTHQEVVPLNEEVVGADRILGSLVMLSSTSRSGSVEPAEVGIEVQPSHL